MKKEELIAALYEIIVQAIDAGDWKVDGANDPSYFLDEAEYLLKENGWRLDGIVYKTWIKE